MAWLARLAQLAALVGYVVIAIFQIRNYTSLTVGAEAFYTPVPDWGWICAFIVAMLWLWCTAWLGGTAPLPHICSPLWLGCGHAIHIPLSLLPWVAEFVSSPSSRAKLLGGRMYVHCFLNVCRQAAMLITGQCIALFGRLSTVAC